MDKVKKRKYIRNIKIKPAFFIYVVTLFLVSLLLSALTIHIVDNFMSTVSVYYIDANEDIDRINEDKDGDVQIAVELIDDDFDESNANAILFYARNARVALALILYFIAGIIIAAHLFFKRKLNEPLRELSEAAEKISQEDLDFSIDYSGNDEMGKLCESFEKMRQQLVENNHHMWNMIDEQKRVQRVFSHDIRTPLTVTMGYVDILREYLPEGKLSPEKTDQTLELIQNNLIRLENFVNMMSSMQRLEDIEVNAVETNLHELFSCLEENAKMICWDRLVCFDSSADAEYAILDKMVIEQIFANIVSNASRFAKNKIDIDCRYSLGHLKIVVRDDGSGFSNEALRHALDPYYTESDKRDSEHFGIGLNVCKTLCEKIGGVIECENNNGAQITVTI